MTISEEDFLKKCKELLDYFHVDYSKDVIELTDGGNSCIMNPTSHFYELLGGYSINEISRYVANKTGKKVIYVQY